MKVIVTGATGNLGTSVLGALTNDEKVESIIGLARRIPSIQLPKVTWQQADVVKDDLGHLFNGADVVMHLAWAIQPSHKQAMLHHINVDGSERVFRAAIEAGVKKIIYASSVGTYAPGPKDHRVDESWPNTGIQSSGYSRDKATVERIIERMEALNSDVSFVRMRPGLMVKHEAAQAIHGLFVGPLPLRWIPGGPIPLLPKTKELVAQLLHPSDAAEAFRLAMHKDVSGAFNLAADPVIDIEIMARTAKALTVPMPRQALRAFVNLTWRARLQPTDPGWIDIASKVPLMDCTRAEKELDWSPKIPADKSFEQLVEGMKDNATFSTPPLSRSHV